ncbi:MAG TPA: transposase, partial [Candidatus Avalokitesvara rifleensis]|uniref:transposase n=1 Tax=Candidatus Avalokitesvara rifleensis TaxID=3367620 RepID=UPI004029114F
MARPLRLQYPGALYHITARGNERKAIFRSDEDREGFLVILAQAVDRYRLILHAYVLMGNHYHLLVETREANLSLALRHLNGLYTTYFNHIHRRVGHLFQGRYKAILVEKESYLLELSRYIHLNPVRAQVASQLQSFVWSSYLDYVGRRRAPKWLTREE